MLHDDPTLPITGRSFARRLDEPLSRLDRKLVEQVIDSVVVIKGPNRLIGQGEVSRNVHILKSGFAFRTLQFKSKRSIVSVLVPGDFLDLPAHVLGKMDCNVDIADDVEVGLIKSQDLDELMFARPTVAKAIYHSTILDSLVERKWIYTLQQAKGPQRIAHLFCEIEARLRLAGFKPGSKIRTPLRQETIGESCGMTAIHASRCTVRLRSLGLANFKCGVIEVSNWGNLRQFAKFDSDYLTGEITSVFN